MQDFRNLAVWQSARRLTKEIYKLTTIFPESEEYGLKSQMRRASVSICSNIAEGCERRGDREFRRLLDVAMGSAFELECETILSCDLELITEAVQNATVAAIVQIKRMLSGLIGKLLCNPVTRRVPRDRNAPSGSPSTHTSKVDSQSQT
jgi:four helix bundle protein